MAPHTPQRSEAPRHRAGALLDHALDCVAVTVLARRYAGTAERCRGATPV